MEFVNIDTGYDAAAAQVVEIPAIFTVCSHGNTLVTKLKKTLGEYDIIPINFTRLLPESKQALECELFYMGMVPQGYAATHTPHTINLFRTVADMYIIPILNSPHTRATKITKIQEILPTFLIGYVNLIIPHIKILLRKATDKLSVTSTELLIDTNAKVNLRKAKVDRLTSSEVPDVMNDITTLSEEVQDLVNILCALLFNPASVVWCAFIDKDNPNFYKKLFTTTPELLEENKEKYSWDIICQINGEEFGLFGNPEKPQHFLPELPQDNLKITNEDLISRVFLIPNITKVVMIDGSCAIVLNANNHITDKLVIDKIQDATDNLLGVNKITISPEQAEIVATQVNALVVIDINLLELLNASFIEHGNLASLREQVLKARLKMPKSFQSFIVNKNIELMIANKNGLLYRDELNSFLSAIFKNKKMRRYNSLHVMSGSQLEVLTPDMIRASTLGSEPRSLNVRDDAAFLKAKANLKNVYGASAKSVLGGGSRRKNASKKSMKRNRKTRSKRSIRQKRRRNRITRKRG